MTAQSNPKIGEIDNDEKIVIALKYIFGLIGLKGENLPNPEQKMILIDFIKSQLKKYSPDEMVVAFKMLVAGQLTIEGEHYQNFNAMYLAKVMNKYNEIRLAAIRHSEKNKPEPVVDPNQKSVEFAKLVQQSIKFYKKTGQLTFGIIPAKIVYDFLNDLKVVEMTPEDKVRISNKATEISRHNYERRKFTNINTERKLHSLIQDVGFDIAKKDEIRFIAYQIAVAELVEKRNDLIEIIQNYIDK